MPIQGLNFTILPSSEAHQSYQSTGSFIVYNPNDGVAFVATDRTATGLSWDYKVPSQSGGKFPGPINSYLSIYYLDQSGGGSPGQIVVYASPEFVNVPYFWSIGRAVQLQSTSLDIVGGAQPGNPAAGISRLWIDTGGHLNVLQSTGANYVELDSNNFSSYVQPLIDSSIASEVPSIALGGDLYGTIANGHIGLRYGDNIGAYDSGGTLRPWMFLSGGNTAFLNAAGTQFLWNNQANSVQLMSLDNSGNLAAAGAITSTGPLTALDGYLYLPNSSDYILDTSHEMFLRPQTGQVYIQDSTGANGSLFTGNETVSGTLTAPVGGSLAGSLPNPSIAAGAVGNTQLAPGAASITSGYGTSTGGAVTTTTPGALFGGTASFTITTTGQPIFLFATITGTHNTAGAHSYLDLFVNGGWTTISVHTCINANTEYICHTGFGAWGVTNIGALPAGTYTITLGMHVSSGQFNLVGTPLLWLFGAEFRK